MRNQKWSSPGYILAITIGGIALAEVIAMIVVYYLRYLPYYQQVLLDAFVMTVIIFPLLYTLSFQPLLQQLQHRSKSESILQARLRLMQYSADHTLDELLQFTLDEIETLTGSTIGFFHMVGTDQKSLWLRAWSTNTLQNMCRAEGKGSHYDVDKAGVWADCVRQRQPVIHNDYASLPDRKGMPEGHARVVREMAVPIIRNEKVTAILGLGNKPQHYTPNDVEIVATFADFAWDILEHKRAETAIRQSEEKFRTLVDWTHDWEQWLGPQGTIIYSSPSCLRITGYSPEQFLEDPTLLVQIVHPEDREAYEKHLHILHDETTGPQRIEYRILARDGSERWIEHDCRPLFSPDEAYLGRRVSSRDITDRKLAEQKIVEQNQREAVLAQTIQTLQADIARDLHDTLGQNISYIRMNLEHLSEIPWKDLDYPKKQIQRMTQTANESYDLIREMLDMLHTGYTTDPLHLFNRYAEQVVERSGFHIHITNLGTPRKLAPQQTRQIFFIFREALNNAEKHACASRVDASFHWQEQGLRFSITDDGKGFDPQMTQATGHYGFQFMRERAELINGSLSIHSNAGKGTTITVSVPYNHIPFSG